MKTIIKLCYAFMLVSLLSCEDAITIEQPGQFSEENLDIQLLLVGAYGALDAIDEISLNAALTDEVHIGLENGGEGLDLLNFNLNESTPEVEGIWLTYYTAIGLANRIIQIEDPPFEDPLFNSDFVDIVGQAYAIRAFSHFQILSYFSTDYTDDNTLAGILMDFVPDDIFQGLPRSTNGEFYELINSDLNMAEDLISDIDSKFKMRKDFITALRARMEAYRGNYALADEYAEGLLYDYRIANREEYFRMYSDEDFTEIIFSLNRTKGDNYDNQNISAREIFYDDILFILEVSRPVYNILNGTCNPSCNLCDESFECLDSGDVRFDLLSYFKKDDNYSTNPNYLAADVLLLHKYGGSKEGISINDLKIFRAAEMLLIRAEAAADAGDYYMAAIFVQELRNARFGSPQPMPFYANEAEAFGAILDERRIEFMFEGHRWKDLKRLGARGNRAIDRDMKECSSLSECTLSVGDYRFTLPIPQIELDGNVIIRDQQNPGY